MTQKTIEEVTKEFEQLRLSSAVTAISSLIDALREYVSLKHAQKDVIKDTARSLVLMLTPFTPHVCEEMWRILGEDRHASTASWPAIRAEEYDEEALETMSRYRKIEEDIRNIMKATKKRPTRAVIYVIPPELEVYGELPGYLSQRLNIDVTVYSANDPCRYDPENKSKTARMGRPGIYLQ